MRISKMQVIGAALCLVGVLAACFLTGKAQATIVGTDHDLSGRGWGTDQTCVYCHTPHNAKALTDQIIPLWNHQTTAATFTLYSSPSLNASLNQPTGNSKACLSCHDGTVALDSYGSRSGTHYIPDGALIGTDLSNDHPVSFTYDAALAAADGGLVTPASATQVVPGIPLYASQLQCASCHSVHDNSHGNFLRFDNAASALCVKCHMK